MINGPYIEPVTHQLTRNIRSGTMETVPGMGKGCPEQGTNIKKIMFHVDVKQLEAAAKPKRKRTSPDQLHTLSELFQQTNTPSFEIREKVASQLNMTNREVQVWFQNRRAKANRTRLQHQHQEHKIRQRRVYYPYQPKQCNDALRQQKIKLRISAIDILADAAYYVRQWEEERKRIIEQKYLDSCPDE